MEVNTRKLKEEIENYNKNRELAKRNRDNIGAIAFCNGAIHVLNEILNGEFK